MNLTSIACPLKVEILPAVYHHVLVTKSVTTRHTTTTVFFASFLHLAWTIVVVVPTPFVNMTAGGRKNSDMNVVCSASLLELSLNTASRCSKRSHSICFRTLHESERGRAVRRNKGDHKCPSHETKQIPTRTKMFESSKAAVAGGRVHKLHALDVFISFCQ